MKLILEEFSGFCFLYPNLKRSLSTIFAIGMFPNKWNHTFPNPQISNLMIYFYSHRRPLHYKKFKRAQYHQNLDQNNPYFILISTSLEKYFHFGFTVCFTSSVCWCVMRCPPGSSTIRATGCKCRVMVRACFTDAITSPLYEQI